jgi:hypothetical protein
LLNVLSTADIHRNLLRIKKGDSNPVRPLPIRLKVHHLTELEVS